MYLGFLKIDGVPSQSVYAHHAHWMDCSELVLDKLDPGHSSIGRKHVSVRLPRGIQSQILFQMCASGEFFGSAVLEAGPKNADAKFRLQFRIRMTDGFVSSFKPNFDDSTNLYFEHITLDCGAIASEFGSAAQFLHEKVHVPIKSRARP